MISYPVEVAGQLTRVIDSGVGDDVLILLHGAMTTATRWQGTVQALGELGWRVMSIDMPGCGFACQTSRAPLSVPAFAEFIGGFMDEMQFEVAAVGGGSLGAHVAATVACSRPSRISHLILMSPLGIVTSWDQAERSAAWESYRHVSRDSIANSLSQRRLSPVVASDVEETYRMDTTPGHRDFIERMIPYMSGEGWVADALNDQLAAITPTVPTTLIWGTEATRFPVALGQQIHQALPESRLVLVSGAQHDVDIDAPEAFHAAVDAALRGQLDQLKIGSVSISR
jgi:2-hydroxy-6-oxonona-2,4-dienedioate hydrolase